MEYWVPYCPGHDIKPLPKKPPTDGDQVWSLSKIGAMLNVECNGVLILQFDTSECEDYWRKEIHQVTFHSSDSASEQYQLISQDDGGDDDDGEDEGDWTKVIKDVKIAADLQENQLQIKTSAAEGSSKAIRLFFWGEDNYELAGGIMIRWFSDFKYWISFCTGEHNYFPTEIPAGEDKIWSISKVGKMLNVECNGVLVLEYDTSICSAYWENDIKRVQFDYSD